MGNNLAIIGTVGIPARYGGFETLAHQLVLNLTDKYKFTIYCSSKNYPSKIGTYHEAKLIYIPLRANGIQSILYDIISILDSVRSADILLILGVSGCLVLPFIKIFTRKKIIIVNVDGIEWQRQKWNSLAKWFLKFSERKAVESADIIIADNLEIQKYLTNNYGRASELIEYGGDHVKSSIEIKANYIEFPYAFTVCRIEPENNIHILLEALAGNDKLGFICVGNWHDSVYGRTLRKKYQSAKGIWLSDPIYNQQALDTLRSNCVCYLHGHSAGGTNPSLVEAMFLGLPILAYDVPYNRATTENRAYYFKTAHELKEMIACLKPNNLRLMANEMAKIATRRYTWRRISLKYDAIFQNLTQELSK